MNPPSYPQLEIFRRFRPIPAVRDHIRMPHQQPALRTLPAIAKSDTQRIHSSRDLLDFRCVMGEGPDLLGNMLQICFQPKCNASLVTVLFDGVPTLSRPFDEVRQDNSCIAIDPIKDVSSFSLI